MKEFVRLINDYEDYRVWLNPYLPTVESPTECGAVKAEYSVEDHGLYNPFDHMDRDSGLSATNPVHDWPSTNLDFYFFRPGLYDPTVLHITITIKYEKAPADSTAHSIIFILRVLDCPMDVEHFQPEKIESEIPMISTFSLEFAHLAFMSNVTDCQFDTYYVLIWKIEEQE